MSHIKISVSLEEKSILKLMGKGKSRSKTISEAIGNLLRELEDEA